MERNWISKHQPIYVFLDDLWYREIDGRLFRPCIETHTWICGEEFIPFTKKTIIMKFREKNGMDRR